MSSKKDVYAAMFRKKNLATFNVSPKAAEKMKSVSRPSKFSVIPSGKSSSRKSASGTVVSIQKVTASGKSFFQLVRAHRLFLGFIVILLFGMILGTIAAKNADENLLAQLDFLFASNFKSRIQQYLCCLSGIFFYFSIGNFSFRLFLVGRTFDPAYHIF